MVEKKFLDAQKIQSHLNAIKVMAQTLLQEVEKVEAIIEAKQPSNKALERRKKKAADDAHTEFLFRRSKMQSMERARIAREKGKGE